MMRYSNFMPRLYHYCLSLGMEPGKIMPSRAFCSDESQGYPIILIAKQFGTFPFNHGMVGGVVATDRHGPHAAHGKDMVIIQASHVGYDPKTNTFGTYRRVQTDDCHHSTNCGKVFGVLKWYQDEYRFACENIILEPAKDGMHHIAINNLLLHRDRDNGLILELEKLIARDHQGEPRLIRSLSTSRRFEAAPELINRIGDQWPKEGRTEIGNLLPPDMFHYQRELDVDDESRGHLEKNLLAPMPWIVTDYAPALAAAQINTQVEFDRAYRTIIQEPGYQNRKLIFIAGLNVDISPEVGQTFPLTKFIPWAAYVQDSDGSHEILEQQEIFDNLMRFDTDGTQQIDLEEAIAVMEGAEEVTIPFDFR